MNGKIMTNVLVAKSITNKFTFFFISPYKFFYFTTFTLNITGWNTATNNTLIELVLKVIDPMKNNKAFKKLSYYSTLKATVAREFKF
jgi:dihydrodipicolinate synthase/N-acetylneuraminate lyase